MLQEAATTSNESNQNQKPNYQAQERTKFDRDTLNQEKHDNVTDPTSTGNLFSDTNPQNVAC